MESQKLDIVELIELNPITKLSKPYQGKFIEKIQKDFTESQQQLFIASFYTFLNYNTTIDFVIELENIWKWLGFSRKDPAKVVLEKHFIKDTDYKIIKAPETSGAAFKKSDSGDKPAPEVSGAAFTRNLGGAGKNKEKILMTINTFKKLCLKSHTKKADEIHDYYIKLEELIQETVTEESDDLRLQLQEQKTQFIQDKETILLNSYNKKSIVYLIKITITLNDTISILYKFGYTDHIRKRLNDHKRDIYKDCTLELIYCIESKNSPVLENRLKSYLTDTEYRKDKVFETQNSKVKIQTELLDINDITIIQDELIEMNKKISQDKDSQTITILKLQIQKLKEEQRLTQLQINNNQPIQKPPKPKKVLTPEQLEKQRENARKRNQKYRQSEKYKEKTKSEEFKQLEKQRYEKRRQTDEYKKYKREYWKRKQAEKKLV